MLEEKRGSREWRRRCSLGKGKMLITPSPRKVEYFCRSETRVLVVNEKVAIIGGWGRFWGSCKAKYNWRARMRGKMRMRGCLITCWPWRMGLNVLGGLDYLEFLESSWILLPKRSPCSWYSEVAEEVERVWFCQVLELMEWWKPPIVYFEGYWLLRVCDFKAILARLWWFVPECLGLPRVRGILGGLRMIGEGFGEDGLGIDSVVWEIVELILRWLLITPKSQREDKIKKKRGGFLSSFGINCLGEFY